VRLDGDDGRRAHPSALDAVGLRHPLGYHDVVQADVFDEADFFGAMARSGARVLLIGRRALIAHGLPVLKRARGGGP
jgi:hypothetical protein